MGVQCKDSVRDRWRISPVRGASRHASAVRSPGTRTPTPGCNPSIRLRPPAQHDDDLDQLCSTLNSSSVPRSGVSNLIGTLCSDLHPTVTVSSSRLPAQHIVIVDGRNGRRKASFRRTLRRGSWYQTHGERSACALRSENANRPVGGDRKINVDVGNSELTRIRLRSPNQITYLLDNRPQVGSDSCDRNPT